MARRESLSGKSINNNSHQSLAKVVQGLLRGNRWDVQDAPVTKRTGDRARRRGSIVLVGRPGEAEETSAKPLQIARLLRANQIVGPDSVVGLRTMAPEAPLPGSRRLNADASALHKTIVDEIGAISTLNTLPIRALSRRRESPYDVLLEALDELHEEVKNVEPHPDSPSPCLVVVTDVRYAATVFGHRVPALIDLGKNNLIGRYEVGAGDSA